MSGLLTKDLRLISQRKEAFLLFIVMAAFMGFAMDGAFVVGYLTLLGAVLGMGTLSYDEMDNGLSFILTWPIKRKTYVAEKYIFCFLISLVSWIFGLVAYLVINMIKNTPVNLLTELPGALVYLPAMLLVVSIMLPVELKFGPEKSRLFMLIIFGAIAAIVVIASGLLGNSENRISELAERLNAYDPVIVSGIMAAVCLVICLLSFLITVKIVEKREF